ncbi:glycerophosphodiester phosphodiesterase [Oceanobacillus sojae]|uniref:glycerophosphodiester phosphodiesterase n=1 Tax=Oceanobacillus sojae TaxID=582851 RepID=UPI0009886954|nr:glycerophosphodiester phosphodiesterase family protein [Oceanobacillus sojae]
MPWRRILLGFVIAVFIISGFFEAKPTAPQTTALYGAEALYAKAAENPEAASADIEIIANPRADSMLNEDTKKAYKNASDANADSIKMDLGMTKDNELIAFHDTGDRIMSESKAPEELILKEIAATFEQNEHYYFESHLVNGDTKMEEPLIKLLEEYDLLDPKYVSFQSFSKKSLQKLQELAPEIRLTLLYGTDKFDLEDALAADVDVIGVDSGNVTRDIVDKLHQHGKEIHVFFTDERTELVEQQRVIMYGVDGVFTNDIEFTNQVIMQ